MVKSEQIYSPQSYLEAVTGKYYLMQGENDVEFIWHILVENGFWGEYWGYPLSAIDHIVKNNLNVVLVDCMVVNPKTNKFENQYRWFEVPEDFKEEE